MHIHAGSTRYSHITLTFDLLTPGSYHRVHRLPRLVLTAQVVFLLERGHTYTKVTDAGAGN